MYAVLVLALFGAQPADAGGGAVVASSLEDPGWALQAAARPWTREEMLAAQPVDLPAVTEAEIERWAAEAATAPPFLGVPGSLPSGLPTLPGPAVVEMTGAGGGPAVDEAKGYAYPNAPFARFEAFPSYSTFPYRTVGKVFFTKPGIGSFVCSASSAGGDGVLTAAHCVRDGSSGNWWTNWVFVPQYRNGAAPLGQWTANHLWSMAEWVNGNGGDFRHDIGGAVLNRKARVRISQRVGYLGFSWNQDNGSRTAHFALVGYPQAAPFNGKLMYVCLASWAYARNDVGTPNPFAVGCDMTGGCSGGPWIRQLSGAGGATNYLNGVNSHRRCYDNACTQPLVWEMFAPYFDGDIKMLRDCVVNSVPGNPANPDRNCAPGT